MALLCLCSRPSKRTQALARPLRRDRRGARSGQRLVPPDAGRGADGGGDRPCSAAAGYQGRKARCPGERAAAAEDSPDHGKAAPRAARCQGVPGRLGRPGRRPRDATAGRLPEAPRCDPAGSLSGTGRLPGPEQPPDAFRGSARILRVGMAGAEPLCRSLSVRRGSSRESGGPGTPVRVGQAPLADGPGFLPRLIRGLSRADCPPARQRGRAGTFQSMVGPRRARGSRALPDLGRPSRHQASPGPPGSAGRADRAPGQQSGECGHRFPVERQPRQSSRHRARTPRRPSRGVCDVRAADDARRRGPAHPGAGLPAARAMALPE